MTPPVESGHICHCPFWLLSPLHLIHPVRSRAPVLLLLHAEQGVQAAGASQCCPSFSPALWMLMERRLYLVPGLTAEPGLCLGLRLCLRMQQ